MFSICQSGTSDQGSLTRRELLRVGGLSLLGLSALDLARLRTSAATPGSKRQPPQACVFLFLFGGPSQIDLWDMKPRAPAEIRGEFTPVATAVPGVQMCEHLPMLAQQIDKICLVRSMTHRMNVHGPACSEVFTGREYFGPPTTDQALPEDWPSLSAMAARYGNVRPGLPFSVVLPWYLQFPGQSKRIAGQTGGRMGEQHNAFLIDGDLARPDYELEGLRLFGDVPLERLERRRRLESLVSSPIENALRAAEVDRLRGQAYDLLRHQAADVFDLRKEPESVRDRYGRTTVGQSLLLARRLVESGVSLVTVNWQDETKIDGVNTCWDTHQQNFSKLKNLLCPIMDRAFSAFVADLADRGLLDTTLVVALGEFGRTPKMGQFTQSANTQSSGRDHWPHAFTALLAGGGVRGGQVYGATTSTGGYVADKPVTPADLSATVLHHLGVDPARVYEDEFQHLRHRLSDGALLTDLVGAV
jgi:Protein of unknown function (DUF1501)